MAGLNKMYASMRRKYILKISFVKKKGGGGAKSKI